MKKLLFIACLSLLVPVVWAQDYFVIRDQPYQEFAGDEYTRERCKLDMYYPADTTGFATVVWFHGGGLTGGNKFIPEELKEKGIAIVAPNYRLSPRVNAPEYMNDAAWAVAWVVDNIVHYGGDPSRIYVAGHSAGAYLVSLLALDRSWLESHVVDADAIRGWMPISGQAATHWQVLRERGKNDYVPVVDVYAPLSYIRKNTAPIILTAGQTELEMDNRTVENRYLYEALRTVGNENVRFHELSGFDHNTVVGPSLLLLLEMIGRDSR